MSGPTGSRRTGGPEKAGSLVGGVGSAGLADVLEEARRCGFIGPGDVAAQMEHAAAFAVAVGAPARAVDLGSGGGLPALVLAGGWPQSAWTMVESMHKRAEFLRQAVVALALGDRVQVVEDRAEAFGQDARVRGSADLVTARGFGAPALVAEAAAPLLRAGGRLAVSEPPDLRATWDRWPAVGLARAGLVGERVLRTAVNVRVLRLAGACPPELPRRANRQQREPLW